MSSHLTETQNIALGTMASVCQCIITQPTLYWKNAAQQSLPFTINPRIVYRGIGVNLVNEGGQMGFQFGAAGFFKKLFGSSSTGEMTAALLAGTVISPFVQSCDITMIQQQRFGGSLQTTARRIHQEFGFCRGLFRGYSPLVIREALFTGGLLGTTPLLQDWFAKQDLNPNAAEALAAVISGVATGVLSCPFDAMSTSMKGDLSQKTYGGFRDTLRQRLAGGPRVIFGGALWRSVNIAGTILIANGVSTRVQPYVIEYNTRHRVASQSGSLN